MSFHVMKEDASVLELDITIIVMFKTNPLLKNINYIK